MHFMNLSVSTKLAIASGISLLLVAGMVANEHFSSASLEQAYADALRQQKVVENATAGATAIRKAEVAMRDTRLAGTTALVQTSLGQLLGAASDGRERMEAARRLSTDPASQERMDKVAAMFDEFATRSTALATVRNEYLNQQTVLTEAAGRWNKGWEQLEATLGYTTIDNREDVESNLREGGRLFMDARNAFWDLMTSGNAQLERRMNQLILTAMASIRQAKMGLSDTAVSGAIDQLLTAVGSFKTGMEASVKAWKAANETVTTGLVPLGKQIDEILPQIAAAAEQSAEAGVAHASAQMTRTASIRFAVGGIAFAILIGTALFGRFSIGRPLTRVGAVLLELAHGNKAVEIPYVTRGDEVGDAARAASTFRDNLVEMERLQAEQREAEARIAEEKHAADERTAAERNAAEQKAAAERKAMMERLAAEFETAVGNIVETVSNASHELEAAASSLSKTAETTEQLSATVASASEDASTNVKSVAAASEEMTSSVQEIGRQVNESSRIAGEAVTQAEKTDARIGQLSEAAARIGDVVKLITAIAEQTNLLALNATIEAARAGEAGKGFAVVAQEVKALASQTAKATDEIATQISGMQAATRESVGAIKEISGTVRRISDIATTIAAAVEEQGAATGEISRNALLAAQGTAQVAVNITDVNRGASETGTASARVLASAQSLAGESGRLRREVDNFLNTVRAA
jgi:methyl-accepting chemotaxis protein